MKQQGLVLGSENTFSGQLAAQSAPNAYIKYKPDFEGIIRGLKGVNFAIVPIQNTHKGPVKGVMRPIVDTLSRNRKIKVLGFHRKQIVYSFVSPASSIEDVDTVYSHPQPLGQCSESLDRDGIQERVPTQYTTSQIGKLQSNEAVLCPTETAGDSGYNILSDNYGPQDNSTLFMYLTSLANQTIDGLVDVNQERMLSVITAKREIYAKIIGVFGELDMGMDFTEFIANGKGGAYTAIISDNVQSQQVKANQKSMRRKIEKIGGMINFL